MEIKDLLENLNTQINNLKNFHNVLIQKQQSLIHFDYEGLEKSTSSEEKILNMIQQAENSRTWILRDLYTKYLITVESSRLASFVDKAGPQIGKKASDEILRLEKALKTSVKEISTVNQQNKYLIENAKSFIRETMASLMNDKKSILDRRI